MKARLVAYFFLLLVGVGSVVQGQAPTTGTAAHVYLVHIDSVISPGSAGLLEHAIDVAQASNAAALIVRINTPGGLLSSTRDMVSAISESTVPVVGYVGPSGASATSAGAFILLATHVAVMNTGTNVGAASPVAGTGQDIDNTMAKKVMADTRALMRSIAHDRNRNIDQAERFVSEAESVTAGEAVEQNVIDLVVTDFNEILSAVEGVEFDFQGEPLVLSLAGAEIREVEPRLIDRLLKYIAHPQIAHMLLSLGILAIYIEILSPGLAFPGVFGAIALILGLVGLQTLPVSTGFLLLLCLGVGLMVAEYFVSGFGVLGIGGAVAFVLGSLNLFDEPSSPQYQNTVISVSIAVSAAMLFATFLISRALRSHSKPEENLEGKTGEAMMSFDYQGFVLVHDKRRAAITSEPLRHGDEVVVTGKDEEGRVLVRKRNAS